MLRGRLTARQYVEGILSGNRVALARAITLTESDLPDDADLAAEVLDAVLPYSGKARRVGITGVPGAGKRLVAALPSMIQGLRDDGYALAPLRDLL